MGKVTAQGIAEMEAEMEVPLRAVLHWHLAGNCWPPERHPAALDAAEQVVLRIWEGGEMDEPLVLPQVARGEGRILHRNGTPVTYREFADKFRLWDFAEVDDA